MAVFSRACASLSAHCLAAVKQACRYSQPARTTSRGRLLALRARSANTVCVTSWAKMSVAAHDAKRRRKDKVDVPAHQFAEGRLGSLFRIIAAALCIVRHRFFTY